MLQILHWIALTLNQSDLLQCLRHYQLIWIKLAASVPAVSFTLILKISPITPLFIRSIPALITLFIDKALLSFVNSAQYSAIVISDHAPHILDLCLPSSSHRHQGGWRLNSGLLANADFCHFVSTNIDVFLETNRSDQVSPSLLWETLKAFIRGGIIFFSAHLTKNRRLKQQELLDAILDIDRQQASTINPDLTTKRLQLQTEFDLLSTGKAEYLLRRTRATYYEHGDKAVRLLASQPRHQCASRFIPQISDSSHTLTTDPSKINSEFASFYSTLYKSQPPLDTSVMDAFLNNLDFPT